MLLLLHAEAATHASALRHTSGFAIQLVQEFLKKYTVGPYTTCTPAITVL